MTSKIRVLLADDHKLLRQGISLLISEEADMEVIGEATDGNSAIELACKLEPDVVLMDINMGGLNGIEATKRIRAQSPSVQVIGLSMFEAEERAHDLRAAGGADFVSKSGPSDVLLDTIRRTARG